MADQVSLDNQSDDGQNPINAQAGRRYWENADADINGMLGGIPAMGGFSSVSRIDLQGSRTFLARLGVGVKCGRKPVVNALEGGAGCVPLPSRRLQHELLDIL